MSKAMIFVETRGLGRARGADDAAGGSRQDRILAMKGLRVAQAARGLHELQARARQRCGHAIHVAPQHRR